MSGKLGRRSGLGLDIEEKCDPFRYGRLPTMKLTIASANVSNVQVLGTLERVSYLK
jgi:hypothetical protein